MSQFIQLHLLTSYPPSNPNRDDLGRPKTAVMGGYTRLRISSQSLKRAWRTSDVFSENEKLKGHIGTRTKKMGRKVAQMLEEKGVPREKAVGYARQIAKVFGKPEVTTENNPEADLQIKQLAHFSPEEEALIYRLVDKIVENGEVPSQDDLSLLRKTMTAADIALFGRMLADSSSNNIGAAAQVAHAISVHKVSVEDDYFTAVDDLNDPKQGDDPGAAHIDTAEFAAGLFYLYLCINKDLLRENLADDDVLAKTTLEALVEAVATVAPTGKQNSFGSRVRASYILAEKGSQQPRSLSVAFLKPIAGNDFLDKAIQALEDTRDKMDKVYGPCADAHQVMNAVTPEGSLSNVITFVTGD